MFRRCLRVFFFTTLLLLSIRLTAMADTNWIVPSGQSGDWSVGSNWNNGVPTSGTTAYINNGGTAKIANTSMCDNLTLGQDSANSGTVQMTSGSFSPNYAYIG